jgi:hypothetical protein
MVMRSSILLALMAALTFSTFAADAQSRDWNGHRHKVVKIKHAKTVKVNIGPRIVVRRGVVDVAVSRYRHRIDRQMNTYSGNVAVYTRNGVGTWSYGTTSAMVGRDDAKSELKIIDLDKLAGRNDCQMEAGVCVIRP